MTSAALITTRIHRTVDELPLSSLEPLFAAGTLYDSPGWLRYCEAAADGLLRHITLEDGEGRTVGLASVRIVRDDQVMSLYNLEALLGDPPGTAPGAPAVPLFPSAVAAVSGAHCVMLTDPAADGPRRSAHRGALARAVAELASAESCTATGFLYLDEEAARDVAEALGPEAGAPFLVAAQTELAGGWPDFEHYLATLRSSRRNKIRRERKQFAEGGISTRVLYGTGELNEATARLQLALRQRYGAAGSVESILRDYDHLRATVDDRVRVFLCEREGRPIGMSLALVDGDRLHVRLAGFDYSAAAEFAYFNAVYYEPILWGIDHGITRYSFGTGTYGAKLARGCTPVPLYGVTHWPAPLREHAATRLAAREVSLRTQLGLPPAYAPAPAEGVAQ
ncbi:GNAT family N-acetyltransferase [Streptomyces sp. NRRL F-5755]|uniref:GNAT family N-acetyltransferase n=1 Tax=Streptomyces sp. NRRL F-5755 TaxID=1519475 RepID=UPI0006AD87F6|nr:GNAT family N-acetyltransferase [Streptomyces sp. NRRL F-5755]